MLGNTALGSVRDHHPHHHENDGGLRSWDGCVESVCETAKSILTVSTGTWSSHNWCYIVTQCCNTIDVTLMCPSVLHWHLIEPQLMLSIEELLEIIALQMEICLRNHNNSFSPLTRGESFHNVAMSWSQNVFSKEKSCLTKCKSSTVAIQRRFPPNSPVSVPTGIQSERNSRIWGNRGVSE